MDFCLVKMNHMQADLAPSLLIRSYHPTSCLSSDYALDAFVPSPPQTATMHGQSAIAALHMQERLPGARMCVSGAAW